MVVVPNVRNEIGNSTRCFRTGEDEMEVTHIRYQVSSEDTSHSNSFLNPPRELPRRLKGKQMSKAKTVLELTASPSYPIHLAALPNE